MNAIPRRQAILGAASLGAAGSLDIVRAQPPSGFRVPAEDAPHRLSFMQWPVSRQVYADPAFLEMVQQTIADVANSIVEFEPVAMLAAKDDHLPARRRLSARVELWDIPSEDLWCRDSGPIFVINDAGDIAVSHIQFNGWGNKQVHRRDARIAARVAERLALDLLPSGLTGEAGGVEQDGHGLLLAHESSWADPNRNPNMPRQEIEARLLKAYGARRMIWAKGVYGLDITDYHIDSLARFTGPGRALVNLPDPPDRHDPFHNAAQQTHARLLAEGLDVEVIPEPRRRRVKSDEFVASYANFYVCNGAVIAPQFGDPQTDRIAQDALARHYPGREIITLNVDPLGELGGGIHCATQQMPAV